MGIQYLDSLMPV